MLWRKWKQVKGARECCGEWKNGIISYRWPERAYWFLEEAEGNAFEMPWQGHFRKKQGKDKGSEMSGVTEMEWIWVRVIVGEIGNVVLGRSSGVFVDHYKDNGLISEMGNHWRDLSRAVTCSDFVKQSFPVLHREWVAGGLEEKQSRRTLKELLQ